MQYDPAIAGTFLEKGLNVQYDLSQADVIVSLDADFLSGASYPGFHKLVRDYAARRKQPENGMNRLYAIESTPTTTGMKAEHRLGLRASEIPAFAAALAHAVGVPGVNAPAYAWTAEQQKFLAALAKDLKANAGKSAVLPGLYQDLSVAALALAINMVLDNVGKTVSVDSGPAIPLASDQLERHDLSFPAFDAGQISLNQYLDRTLFYRPRSFTREEFTAFMFAQSKEYPETRAVLTDVARSGKYYVASINNEPRELNQYRIEAFGLRKEFQAFFRFLY